MWSGHLLAIVGAEMKTSGIEAHVKMSVLPQIVNTDDRGGKTWLVKPRQHNAMCVGAQAK